MRPPSESFLRYVLSSEHESEGTTEACTNLDGTPLAGLTRPVGVLGRELEPFTGVPSLFPDTLLCLLEVGVFPVVLTVVLRGMRLRFVESSANKTEVSLERRSLR